MTRFRQNLEIMKSEGVLNDDTVSRINLIYGEALAEIQDQLRSKIVEWETLEPEGSTLYSLGLRHAEDLIKEERGEVV
jgi:hypothetical protein